MDIVKQLINYIPEAPLLVRWLFFLVTTSILGWYSFFFTPASTSERRLLEQRKEAVAFYLGWNAKRALLPDTPQRKALFTSMGAYISDLGIELEKPIEYYLAEPQRDQGARAQQFTELIYGELFARHGSRVAKHFGAATNLLLQIAAYQHGPAPPEMRAALEELVSLLNIPEDLRRVPSENLLAWANDINAYFEAKL